MTYEEFQCHVCAGADLYLDYLRSNQDKGIIKTDVIKIAQVDPDCSTDFDLFTGARLKNAGGYQIQIDGSLAPSIRIDRMYLRGGKSVLRVTDPQGELAHCMGNPRTQVAVIQDMSFLIQRLRDFYQDHTFSLNPPMPQPLPPLEDNFLSGMSDEQLHAYHGVFSAPVSYISGAPGTGKTKMVLSRCILRYVLDGKRVLLLGPTNNAVEQMLRGILPILEEAGVPMEQVYRLGISTEEFARDYPQVVGDASMERLRQELIARKSDLESQLAFERRRRDNAQSTQQRLHACEAAQAQILPLIPIADELRTLGFQALADDQTAQERFKQAQADCTAAEGACATADTQLRACHQLIDRNGTQRQRLRWQFWKKRQKDELLTEAQELLSQSLRFEELLQAQTESLAQARKRLADAQSIAQTTQEKLIRLRTRYKAQRREILSIAQCDPDYKRLIAEIVDSDQTTGSIDEYLESLRRGFQDADFSALEAMEQQLAQVNQELAQISVTSKDAQRRLALVLAGTVDSSLTEISPASDGTRRTGEPDSIPTAHVFLDEAGYTALAKSVACFAAGAPITFLGDHKQLPPVCEIDGVSESCKPVCLWAVSAAHLSELLTMPLDDFYHTAYQQRSEPTFSRVKLLPLAVSYRFGPLLADVLQTYVYTDGFAGRSTAPFRVLALDVPQHRVPAAKKERSRANPAQARAIARYLAQEPPEDFAILTPYRNQQSELWDTLPQYRDSIMTVHRSQGREWNTVILSVADNAPSVLTTSSKPDGRSLLNTAISRAKTTLILVCDVSAWEKHENQLLTALLQLSDPLYISEP